MSGAGSKKVERSVSGGVIPENPTVGWMRDELEALGEVKRGTPMKESEMSALLISLGYPIKKAKK